MKKQFSFLFVAALAAITLSSCGNSYETVPNDPMNVRIYTLDNGLKVYMTVNHDEPTIQTYVAARVGGKNDPAETTGLSHYFEHLMFKGTEKFGTKDYAAEKILLDQIEELFEAYRNTTDAGERTAIYQKIDSVSQEASKIAIPNEYDKLMSAIGSEGTNAFTSEDVTAYVENIPSNSLELWAEIQADRFENPIIRLFHTELETVYEEKNMSLTQDRWKVEETMMAALFPNHPYGTQTVLGTQEHLKNPSIINIKNHFKHYYVASNMAIILAGDFDPDKAIKVIEKYFGKLPKGNVEPMNITPETPITAPIVKEVWGNDAENVSIGFRFPGASSKEAEILQVVDYLMNNGKAGIIDLNINQKQLALGAGAGFSSMSDYSIFRLTGRPKAGQSLDQVKDLLLAQLDSLKQGAFPDWLIEATINNFKLEEIQRLQYNDFRAYVLLDAFVAQQPWKDVVTSLDRQSKITKEEIVAFVNKHFGNNYAVIYKREGEDKDIKKIDKPQITPIASNRDDESEYLQSIKAVKRTPIEPVFIDYDKDVTKGTVNNNIPLLYKQNTENGLFELTYVFDMGNDNDKALGTAFSYLNYLGTSQFTPEQIKSEFYKIACSYYVNSTAERVYVSVNGLDDNFEAAITLLEELLSDPQVNQAAFDNLVSDIIKQRADAKLNQNRIFNMLGQYAVWGPKSSATNVLSAAELKTLKPEALTGRIKDLLNFQHYVMYYGPKTLDQITGVLAEKHKAPVELKALPAPVIYQQAETKDNKVLFTHYNAKQIYMGMYAKGEPFQQPLEPVRRMYNEYFGGNMSSIVFQEMREARGLAYSASAGYRSVSKPEYNYSIYTFIATQNDKMSQAVEAFKDILNNMPESEKAFNLAKEALQTSIRTERILRSNILWDYVNAQKFGYTQDPRKAIFEQVPNFTLADIKVFQEKYIKDHAYNYYILGDKHDLDFNVMKNLGTVKELSLEEIFGY